jgi:hypothetical protein
MKIALRLLCSGLQVLLLAVLFAPSLFGQTQLLTIATGSVLDSQDTQTPRATAKPLTNADVLGMLSAGLTQDIVIAKIAASACEFDTSPAALKVLKASNVPGAVMLAMIQAPTGLRRQELTNAGLSSVTPTDPSSESNKR